MGMKSRLAVLGIVPLLFLSGCGGGGDGAPSLEGDPPTLGGGSDSGSGSDPGTDPGTGGGGGGSSSASGVSYVPLSVLEGSKDFSGAGEDNLFAPDGEDPLIERFMINPIDAATLLPVTTAVASDYNVTIDGLSIDESESYPRLQKVLGATVGLRTALVFDVSDSVNAVNMPALVAEAKAYIAACKVSTDATIKNQEFVIWAFASAVLEMTNDATSDTATLNAALDMVASNYAAKTLGKSSNLHQAVVEAIGSYQGTENNVAYDFRDSSTGDDNDLVDFVGGDVIDMTQLVVFSSGPDTALSFTQETMQKAIDWQSYIKYNAAATGSDNVTQLDRPVFYYVVGGASAGNVYTGLSNNADSTQNLLLSSGAYSFANSLIAKQQAAISARIDLDNLYMYRYAFLPRVGDHTRVFESTNATGFIYSLTGDFEDAVINPWFGISPTVEISGPNDEYFSDGALQFTGSITVNPTTLWSPDTYAATDYSWSVVGGALSGTANANGTYTINSVTTSPATLRLTNTAIGEFFDLTVTN